MKFKILASDFVRIFIRMSSATLRANSSAVDYLAQVTYEKRSQLGLIPAYFVILWGVTIASTIEN